MSHSPFADRLAALTDERHSQLCLGLDPDPASLLPDAVRAVGLAPVGGAGPGRGRDAVAELAGGAVAEHCRLLIDRAGASCVAVKLQLACFERLGATGWTALAETIEAAREAGLLVVADGKRGDVPVSAAAYGQAMVGETPTPWGPIAGLGADAFTANPLLGRDAMEPLIAAAEEAGAGIFWLVRTSNPGAADVEDLPVEGAPLHERLAALVGESAGRLAGETGLSGMGAVVGGTEPAHLARLRELLPASVFLVPGVGAQGGRPRDLGPAFSSHPASAIVTASRSIAEAEDPGAAAEELRAQVWAVSPGGDEG